jgi:hypothetical protein
MMSVIFWIIVGLLIAVVGIGFVWCLHRICVRLEDAGYLYYRTRGPGGGLSGAFYELDRLTRPSIEHVVEAEDTSTDQVEHGGD